MISFTTLLVVWRALAIMRSPSCFTPDASQRTNTSSSTAGISFFAFAMASPVVKDRLEHLDLGRVLDRRYGACAAEPLLLELPHVEPLGRQDEEGLEPLRLGAKQ